MRGSKKQKVSEQVSTCQDKTRKSEKVVMIGDKPQGGVEVVNSTAKLNIGGKVYPLINGAINRGVNKQVPDGNTTI